MAEIYGHKWSSQHGDEPTDTWVRGLRDMTPEQMAAGLRGLLDRTDTWPPNLVEFRQLCLGYDPHAWERRAQSVLYQALLEDKTAREKRRTTGKVEIRKLLESLGD